jgi:cell division protein FtsL
MTFPHPRPRRRPPSGPAAGRASFPEFFFVKQIDNSRLVREVEQGRRREYLSLSGLGVLVFVFVLLVAWQHFRCVRDGYQIEQYKMERKQLEDRNQKLRIEQAALVDPQRIDTLAHTRLGMVNPQPQQVIQVDLPERTSGVPELPELARNISIGSGYPPPEP